MTRLYHQGSLIHDQELPLTDGQTHYLRHVLRTDIGYQLVLFNEKDGDWTATLTTLSKVSAVVTVNEQLRPAVASPNLSLLFTPIKHDPLMFLIEKATELGVRQLHPVITERCNVARVNHDRLMSNVLEAAQQCERFDIPTIFPLMALSKALTSWSQDIPLFVCAERGGSQPIENGLKRFSPQSPIGFLVGPEGGFSSQELAYLKTFSFVHFVTLGPRILRAETAALAALVCYQALVGDWKMV